MTRPRRNSPPARVVRRFLAQAADAMNVSCETSASMRVGSFMRKREMSAAELFNFQLTTRGFPPFEREHRFAKVTHGRQWRFDFAFAPYKIAVEIEGLVVRRIGGELVVQGRHATISGYKEDCIKYATAAELGWHVLRFEQSQVKDETAIMLTKRVLVSKGWAQ